MASTPRQWWAEQVNVGDVVDSLKKKRDDYYGHLESTGRLDVWREAARRYYGYNSTGVPYRAAAVEFGGQYGEVSLVQANEVRALVDDFLVLVTGTRLSVSTAARNTSGRSIRTSELGTALHSYYSERKGLESTQIRTAFYATLFGLGYGINRWNPTKGAVVMAEPVEMPDGTIAMQAAVEGDLELLSRHPLDVVRDPVFDGAGWYLVRSYANRFDLAALYPDARDRLMNCQPAHASYASHDQLWMTAGIAKEMSDEMVCVEDLYVAQSPAIPSGRHMMVVGGDVDLFDSPLAGEMPVLPLVFEQEIETPFGSTRVTDILELQEVLDSAMSTWLTSHDAFGIPTIYVGADGGLAPSDLRALRMIKGPTKPEVMSFGDMGDGSERLIEFVRKMMQAQMGLNSVSRGEPDAKMSGTAYALLASMAVKAVSGFQRNFAIDCVEKNANMLIDNLRRHAKSEQLIDVAGRGRASRVIEFKADDLAPIVRMRVDIGSALTNTLAGRQDLANRLLDAGMLNRDEYMEAIQTGHISPLQDASAAMAKAQSENEYILEWAETPEAAQWTQAFTMAQQMMQPPPPLPPDLEPIMFEVHGPHVRAHRSLMDEPTARSNPVVMAIVSYKITKHRELRAMMDPVLAEMTGQEPLKTPIAPPMPLGPGAGPPNPDAAVPVNVPGASDNPVGPAGKLPSLPKSPLDGQRVNMPGQQ